MFSTVSTIKYKSWRKKKKIQELQLKNTTQREFSRRKHINSYNLMSPLRCMPLSRLTVTAVENVSPFNYTYRWHRLHGLSCVYKIVHFSSFKLNCLFFSLSLFFFMSRVIVVTSFVLHEQLRKIREILQATDMGIMFFFSRFHALNKIV